MSQRFLSRPISLFVSLLLALISSSPCIARPQIDTANLAALHEPTSTSTSLSSIATGDSSASNPITSPNTTFPYNLTNTIPKTLSPAQCIASGSNQAWLSLTGPVYGPDCQATLEIIITAVKQYNNTPYYFYSEQALPYGLNITTSWALPVGAETTFSQGNCVGVVRMRRDFVPAVLPISDPSIFNNTLYQLTNRTYPALTAANSKTVPQQLPVDNVAVQLATWGQIITQFRTIMTTCTNSDRLPGYALVGDIIVAFWARNSQIDGSLGFYTPGTPSRNPNVTSTTS